MKYTHLAITIITAIGLILRSIYTHTPPLLWDEAALGYNAYSILHTLRDEHGQLLPIVFRSFGDFKPGAYIYLSLPFIYTFGLNQFSVRLLSILAGTLSIPLLYFLIARQTKNRQLAIISSFILATSPFHIHFSRGAWETNLNTFLILLGIFLFTQRRYFYSSLIFGLTLWTYQSAKLLTPLIILSLIVLFPPRQIKSIFFRFILPFSFFLLPIIAGIVFSTDANRLRVISLLSYSRPVSEQQLITNEGSPTDYSLFYQPAIFLTRNFLSRYFNHFSPQFLFTIGDWQNSRHSAVYSGQFLILLLPFLLFGIFQKPKSKSPLHTLMLIWLLIAPLPAALTRDSVSSVRSHTLIIPLIFFIALGVTSLTTKLKLPPNLSLISLALLLLLPLYLYLELYYNHTAKKNPTEYLYGYQSAINYTIKEQSKYDQIIFTPFYGQPYIFYLFFSQYPPLKYQALNSAVSSGLDVGQVDQVDNIFFSTPHLGYLQSTSKTLLIFSHDEILRQGIDKQPIFDQFVPLSPINSYSTFYAYHN